MPGECCCFTIKHKNELSCITNAMSGTGLACARHDTQGTGLVADVVGIVSGMQHDGRHPSHD